MKKVIIIGAGVAGLTAGIYAQRNSFDVDIFEQHALPGGECTGWDRRGYHFDGCIHWLMGLHPDSGLHQIWQDTGALDQSVKPHFYDSFFTVTEKGRTLHMYTNVDRLEAHLLDLSPGDAEAIRKFCGLIRKFQRFDMPVRKPYDMLGLLDGLALGIKMLPFMKALRQLNNLTVADFAARFQDPLIRRAITYLIPPEFSAMSIISTLSSLSKQDSGWPMGGSLALSKRMAKRFLDLGGQIHYQSPVETILVEDGKAVGVRLLNGQMRRADAVISCADGHATLYGMLGGDYTDNLLAQKLENLADNPITPTSIQFSAGVAADLSHRPHSNNVILDEPIALGGQMVDTIPIRHFCFDPDLAPEGKSSVTILAYSDYDWWKEKAKNRADYEAEKTRITQTLCGLLEELYPETANRIEVTDLATPLSYERYCNAWRGSWMSFVIGPDQPTGQWDGRLKGLSHFYLGGMWTNFPGGLPGAALGGRWAVQRLCADFKTPFKAGF